MNPQKEITPENLHRALYSPIVTEEDNENALAVAERYLNDDNPPDGYMEMIGRIEAFEDIHYPIDDVTDKSMLDHLIEYSEKNQIKSILKLSGDIEINVVVKKYGESYSLEVVESE